MQSDYTEIWKDVVGYEGYYQVSNTGIVRSIIQPFRRRPTTKDATLKPGVNRGGYYIVRLSVGGHGRTFTIHKLVMLAFVGPRPFGMDICHNDGDRKNNKLDNLRYATRSDNHKDKMKHGTTPKLNMTKVREIRRMCNLKEASQRKIAKMFGVSHTLVQEISRGDAWNIGDE